MTREEKNETALTIRIGGWLRICQIMQARLGRAPKPSDKPTAADIAAYGVAKPVTDDEVKTVYARPEWFVTAERVINECDAIIGAAA
jgi:hypothetical protein